MSKFPSVTQAFMKMSVPHQFLQHFVDCINYRVFVQLIQFFCLGCTLWQTTQSKDVMLDINQIFIKSSEFFSPCEDGLCLGFASQHLFIRFISPVSPAMPAAWLVISSRDGRSPCGIRNRTMLVCASTVEDELKKDIREDDFLTYKGFN